MRLVSRPAHHPTCPLCRESVFLLETRSCEGCRTDYHQACLEEFTGCSTLGCASTTYVEANLGSAQPPPPSASEPQIRVSERPATPGGGLLARGAERASALRARIRSVDLVALGLLASVVLTMVFVAGQGLSTLLNFNRSEVTAIVLALVALSGVVLAAHAVRSRSE